MTPYYSEDGITIYCGDCREILPRLTAESIITDPVWPNSVFTKTVADPKLLLSEALTVADVQRLAIHLGCDSDVRFLSIVPDRFPFLRVCWLDYARPSYKGRLLYGSDVAYIFGIPPAPREGHFLMPGKCMAQRTGFKVQHEIASRENGKMFTGTEADGERAHPCPRRIQHVNWLCNHFAGASVIDPFAGSGTTGLACKSIGIPCTLIEIEERYCEIAAKRLSQSVLAFGQPDTPPPPQHTDEFGKLLGWRDSLVEEAHNAKDRR